MYIDKELIFRVVVFCICLFIFTNNPFVTDVFLPKALRFVPPVLLLGSFLIFISDSNLRIFIFFCLIALAGIPLAYWIINGTFILSNSLLLLFSYIMLFVVFSVNRTADHAKYLIRFWDSFVWISIVSTIAAFFLFNLFNELGYSSATLGNYTEANTFFNPVLGGVSTRPLVSFVLGRVSWFLSEPSYLGFLHGLNIFWFSFRKNQLSRKRYITGFYCSILAFLFTFSIGSWLSLIIALAIFFLFQLVSFMLNLTRLKYKLIVIATLWVTLFVVLSIVFFEYIQAALLFFDEYISNLDKYSSLDDRTSKIEDSLRLINQMNFFQFVVGYGPGTIETIYGRGESNGWLKSFIEVGSLSTFVYLLMMLKFILVNKRSFLLVLFVMLSFNSIIILYSPVVIFYLSLLYFLIQKHEHRAV